MSEKTFECRRITEYAYCDYRGDAKLSYLLAVAQQISMEHCNHEGIGGDFFSRQGMAFLLAKLRLNILQTPHGGEELVLFTKPNMPVRAQYRRRTNFSAADGTVLAQMDARWVLADTQSRRLIRKPPEGISLPFLDAEELTDFRPAPPPSLPEPTARVRVAYSMVDVNGHMNNTVYGDLITNLLEHRLMVDKRLSRIEIFYHKEALFGDFVDLCLHENGDSFFIRGFIGSTVCFDASGLLETVLQE